MHNALWQHIVETSTAHMSLPRKAGGLLAQRHVSELLIEQEMENYIPPDQTMLGSWE